MSINSRLGRGRMRYVSDRIVDDNFTTVKIWRDGSKIATLRTRIAPTTRGTAGRDRRPVQGDVSPQTYVMAVPKGTTVQSGDDVWAGSDRYRVVSVDRVPQGRQVIMERLQ